MPATALLLAGAALNTFLSAIVSLVMLFNEQSAYAVLNWLLGGLSGRSWAQLRASLPYMAIGLSVLWLLARPLDALAFGDETAQSLGLPLGPARGIIVAAASLTTAAAVAAGGTIGFVGLIAPHAARLSEQFTSKFERTASLRFYLACLVRTCHGRGDFFA